ncbi:hypothetical protein [Mycobacterium sp.]|uniref:hypothetical protein n=1 Tax=Mycobacterium sp. TaxID=1785 RepID=UPI003D0CAACD
MTDLPFITNAQSSASGKKANSIFRSGGQTKEFHQRPRIAATKPQPRGSAQKPPTGGKGSK